MVTLIDSYSEENENDSGVLRSLHPSDGEYISAFAQSFTCDETINIHSAKFFLAKAGNPTGNAHAVLYAHSGTYGTNSVPTGDPLATSDDFDVSTLTTEYQLITFNFTGEERYEMQADTKYCIVFENPTAGTINPANYPYIGWEVGAPTHDGNSAYFSDSDWASFVAGDVCFYVYGEEVAPPPGKGTIAIHAKLAGMI